MPIPPKRKPDSARRANRIIQQRTLLLLALLGIGTFLLLFAQLYKLQIKQHDELKTLAVRQQTLRTTVEASRGTIYDKNGDILALSSTAENVCVSPLDVAKNEQDQDLIANGLGEILGVDPSGILFWSRPPSATTPIPRSPRTSSALSTPTAAPTALRPCMTRS